MKFCKTVTESIIIHLTKFYFQINKIIFSPIYLIFSTLQRQNLILLTESNQLHEGLMRAMRQSPPFYHIYKVAKHDLHLHVINSSISVMIKPFTLTLS